MGSVPIRTLPAVVLLALAGLVFAGACFAHTTGLALGRVERQGTEIVYKLTLSAHDLLVAVGEAPDLDAPVPATDLAALRETIEAYVSQRLQIVADGAVCPVSGSELELSDTEQFEDVVLALRFQCPQSPVNVAIRYLLFFDIDTAHRSVLRVVTEQGASEYLFDRTITSITFDFGEAISAGSGLPFWRIVVLGAEHILMGVDHLLFLASLLVLPLGGWRFVKIITAFTVAHSCTLALAWYELVTLPPAWVETAIALSIAYVAVENILGIGARYRWAVAGLFGLIHGLGFFSVLSDLELQHTNAVKALVGFNLGVELGQLAVLAVCLLPLVWWWRQSFHRQTAIAVSAVLFCIALFWAAERTGLV